VAGNAVACPAIRGIAGSAIFLSTAYRSAGGVPAPVQVFVHVNRLEISILPAADQITIADFSQRREWAP
jgi:hypothetical protein